MECESTMKKFLLTLLVISIITASSIIPSGVSFAAADTTVTFVDYTSNYQAVNGTYQGVNWGTGNWESCNFGGLTSMGARMLSTSTSQVIKTIVLPTGKVLKSLDVGTGYSTSSIILSSSGNSDVAITPLGDEVERTYITNWTTASANVQIKVTCNHGANDVDFDNIV
jgi:hypothetical protein